MLCPKFYISVFTKTLLYQYTECTITPASPLLEHDLLDSQLVLIVPRIYFSSICDKQYLVTTEVSGGSVAEWLACWTQALKGPGSNLSRDLSGSSLRQTVHTHRASVHQAEKLLAAFLRVAGVTAGLTESNDSLPPAL